MSDPAPVPVPVLTIAIEIALPASATDEQRQIFLRELERLGGSTSLTVTIGVDPSVPPEKREAFAAALRSALEPSPV